MRYFGIAMFLPCAGPSQAKPSLLIQTGGFIDEFVMLTAVKAMALAGS
jgi:hypothetical protein